MLPFRLLPRSRLGRILLRVSLTTVAVLLLLFVAIAALVQTSLRHVLAQEMAVRQAELGRVLVLNLQIDEETGLRGLTITNRRSFLLPFEQARAHFPAAVARLDAELRRVQPSLEPLAQRLQRLNAAWIARVATPTIAVPSSSARIALELRGKTIIDRFRNTSGEIGNALETFANAQDASASTTVTQVLAGSTIFGIFLALSLLFYAGVQIRLGQELSLQADEYERLRRIAAVLQEAFLAEPLPNLANLSFDAVYAPALEEARVGGDWYGAFDLPDGRIYFSMGDVAGHGIAASVTMARIRQTILSIAMHESDPAIVLARANDVLRLSTETMVTALCGFINPATFEISYASAGHPAPLLVAQGGEAVLLPVSGAPLGVTPNPGARTYVRQAGRGSLLVCYTDGLIEFDRDVVLGERRLSKVATAVLRDSSRRPASAIVRATLGDAAQRDDIAVLTVGFGPAMHPQRAAIPPAGDVAGTWSVARGDPDAARAVRSAFVTALDRFPGVDRAASELIFGELVANALEHGAGRIVVRLYATERGPLLVVSDGGSGIPAASRERMSGAPPLHANRGRGLTIVHALAGDVHVAEPPDATIFALLPKERGSDSA